MTSPSAIQNSYPYRNEPMWSRSEKAIARKASTVLWPRNFIK
jgi:hypothetical protein